jgi:hypothetical protein
MRFSPLIILFGLAFTCFMTSCETFGPASRYQSARLMERPFYNEADTSQLYISARLGNGRNYREKDKNYAGEFAVHKSWVSERFYASVGTFGQYGKYKLRDSTALSYYSAGLRAEGGLSVYNDDTEFNFLTLSFSRSYENGDFYRLRQTKDSAVVSLSREHWTTDIQSYFGIRHRFEPNKILGFRGGLGFSFNNELAIYSFLDASYQYDEHLHFNINAALPHLFQDERKVPIKLNNVFSLGVTYGF